MMIIRLNRAKRCCLNCAVISFAIFIYCLSPANAETLFSPDNCEFQVHFPANPTIKKGFEPISNKDYESAELVVPESKFFVRAECILYSKDNPIFQREDNFKGMMVDYSLSNGLRNTEYSIESKSGYLFGSLRGFKDLEGKVITYRTDFHVGSDSVITLTAGGDSKSFPQRGVMRFLKSVEQNSELITDQEIEEVRKLATSFFYAMTEKSYDKAIEFVEPRLQSDFRKSMVESNMHLPSGLINLTITRARPREGFPHIEVEWEDTGLGLDFIRLGKKWWVTK